MSEDQPGERRSWLERLGHFLAGAPEDQEDLLAFLHDAERRQLIDPDAMAMIEGIMAFSGLRAGDIMVPRSKMVVIEHDAVPEDVFPVVTESGHSRYPVIGEDRSEVLGILLAKDLLGYRSANVSKHVYEIMRPTHFIPESKRLNVLLKEFRANRSHMAIVVDEYGAAAGLVTIEDVLEQIVGDIEDEHDPGDEEFIIEIKPSEYLVQALTPIELFNERFGTDFDEQEFDTMGGLIVNRFGHVPKRGDALDIDQFHFSVIQADDRRLNLLKLSAAGS
ncbi:CBS domain-containing protein [Candidatus Methylospira mobilis]|uniref:Magnesium and cobalt efflux protein CorC n=1 Tax=Candidatus Methylospira mobilis TaxID=1808979 RepID=A0A5Q0BIK8_9GAMM|nr:transporter associated domain-containing protein [Candidatus Methylospira mobilis]QFY43715.1 CBS domain-containing protein [Candidatus Methylospira mobilis]WNV04699.1 transporter associated domain-containing protein [Candidatus Methylospira mobilis]